MITTPSTSRLVQSVSSELRVKVLPELSDPALVVELEMMLSMLDMAAVRADREIAWMLEEAAAIDAALSEVGRAGELPGPVRDALDALQSSQPADLTYPEVQRHYGLASEALACAAGLAHAGGARLHSLVWSLLEGRVDHELATIGAYVAVGRSENQAP
jgi:hypothetical protein